jgi:hypothetical protein
VLLFLVATVCTFQWILYALSGGYYMLFPVDTIFSLWQIPFSLSQEIQQLEPESSPLMKELASILPVRLSGTRVTFTFRDV